MEQLQKRNIPKKGTGLFVGSLIGGAIGLAATVVLILIAPLILLGMNDPSALSMPFAALCMFIGGAVGAVVASNLCDEPSFASALISASVMFVPMCLASFIISGERNFIVSAVMTAIIFASSVLASFVVNKISSNNKRNMKKLMKRR